MSRQQAKKRVVISGLGWRKRRTYVIQGPSEALSLTVRDFAEVTKKNNVTIINNLSLTFLLCSCDMALREQCAKDMCNFKEVLNTITRILFNFYCLLNVTTDWIIWWAFPCIQTMPKHFIQSQTMSNHAKPCQTKPNHTNNAKPCQSMPSHIKPCQTLSNHAKTCQTMQNLVKPCTTLSNHAKPCQNKRRPNWYLEVPYWRKNPLNYL